MDRTVALCLMVWALTGTTGDVGSGAVVPETDEELDQIELEWEEPSPEQATRLQRMGGSQPVPETLEQPVPETLVSKKACVQRAAVAHRDCVRQIDASSRDQCFSATYLELSSCIDTAHKQTDPAPMALLAGSDEKVQASQDDQQQELQ